MTDVLLDVTTGISRKTRLMQAGQLLSSECATTKRMFKSAMLEQSYSRRCFSERPEVCLAECLDARRVGFCHCLRDRQRQ
jgi:hypothetical protein